MDRPTGKRTRHTRDASFLERHRSLSATVEDAPMPLPQRAALALVPAVVIALTLGACGAAPTAATRTVTVTRPADPRDVTATPRDAASSDTTSAVTRQTTPSTFTRCDANIAARRHTTTCAFAENVFYAYWRSGGARAIRAYSSAIDATYRVSCDDTADEVVVCSAGDGAVVRFSTAAVDRYTSEQARAYADSHDLGPATETDGRAPQAPEPGPAPAPAPPPPPASGTGDFCSTHDCIPNYDDGNGATVQCADGSFSHSGGIQGACSHHGGVR
jgi:hypothetical protein